MVYILHEMNPNKICLLWLFFDSQPANAEEEGEFMFEDVSKRISAVVSQSLLQNSQNNDLSNWQEVPLEDLSSKFKVSMHLF